jgi:hypothetical protein
MPGLCRECHLSPIAYLHVTCLGHRQPHNAIISTALYIELQAGESGSLAEPAQAWLTSLNGLNWVLTLNLGSGFTVCP